MKTPPALTMLLITGLPGSGKSTISNALLQYVRMNYIETDRCWLSVFPTPQYTREESNAVFLDVCQRVDNSLTENQSTLTEGVFASHERILALKKIANFHRARLVLIGLRCDKATAFERMDARYKGGGTKAVPASLWLELQERLHAWEAKEHVFLIDSSANSPEAAAGMILPVLSQNP